MPVNVKFKTTSVEVVDLLLHYKVDYFFPEYVGGFRFLRVGEILACYAVTSLFIT